MKEKANDQEELSGEAETIFHFYPDLADDPSFGAEEELLTGRVIQGRFEVKELIGHGGFGSVYLACQTSVDRLVVLKTLRPELVGKGNVARRFLLEAKATSRLTNPHTVTIFDYGETDDGLLFIAMEYLRGRTLLAKIDEEKQLSSDETIRIALEMAESLSEAHAHQIVHRDLKPENILLIDTSTASDFVKVLDFGIARARPITGDMTLTRTGQLSGTPPYMAPEIIRGKNVDSRADVYSMGIIMYQMLSGRCPFQGNTPFDVFMKHVQEKAPSLKEMGVHVSPSLQHFLDRCLAKDVSKRPLDAGVFLKDLRKVMGSESKPHVHARMASENTSHDLLGLTQTGNMQKPSETGNTGIFGKVYGSRAKRRSYGPMTEMLVISRIRKSARIWAGVGGLLIAGILFFFFTDGEERTPEAPAVVRAARTQEQVPPSTPEKMLPIEKEFRVRSQSAMPFRRSGQRGVEQDPQSLLREEAPDDTSGVSTKQDPVLHKSPRTEVKRRNVQELPRSNPTSVRNKGVEGPVLPLAKEDSTETTAITPSGGQSKGGVGSVSKIDALLD